jgi:hypothetical protein
MCQMAGRLEIRGADGAKASPPASAIGTGDVKPRLAQIVIYLQK